MNRSRCLLLQLCPFSEFLELGLKERFTVHKLFEDPDPETWLAANASEVRAVATGGHIGIPTALLEQLPRLGIVAVNGVGLDKIDLEVAKTRGIRVTTTPSVLTDDVADLAVGLIITLLRDIAQSDAFVRAGGWLKGNRPLARKVTGRHFGIVGLGQIGSAIAHRLSVFGPVSYTDLINKGVPHRFVPTLEDLAKDSDVLVLASSASAGSTKLINAQILDALGAQGVLVNVARGSLVDEAALILALQQKRIAGAALDVFADEPNIPRELLGLPNVLLTPHVASATVETREQMARVVLDNLYRFVDGRPLRAAVI